MVSQGAVASGGGGGLKYGSDLRVSFVYKCSPLLSLLLCLKKIGEAKISNLPKICDVLFLEQSKCEISQLKNLRISNY